MPNIKQHLSKLVDIVDNVFIPAIIEGHVCSTDERLLLSLPEKERWFGNTYLFESCRI
jgi:hypothetical protein